MPLLSSLPLAAALAALALAALSAVRGRVAAPRLVPVRVRADRARTDA